MINPYLSEGIFSLDDYGVFFRIGVAEIYNRFDSRLSLNILNKLGSFFCVFISGQGIVGVGVNDERISQGK